MLLHTVFGNRRYTQNDRIYLENISSLSVSNPGTTDVTLIIQGVATVIPFWDKTKTVVPIQFDINGDGTLSRVEFDIEFATGEGEAIVYFRQHNTN